MAPIEPDLANSNIGPLSIFGSYLTLASGLTIFVSRNILYRAYRSLPPSQATRLRASNRRKHVLLFATLAAASLAMTWYHTSLFFALSYRSWAHDVGEALPQHWWGESGVLGSRSTGIALGRWLKDTDLFTDAWEIVIEKSRRYWWSQQLILGAAAWSIYISVEGRRRNIRHLWAFVLLAEVVSVSFAMNLFFVAVLLTAVPLTPRKNEARATVGSSNSKRRISTTSGDRAKLTWAFKVKATTENIWTIVRPYLPPLPTRPHYHTWEPHALALFAPIFVAHTCAFLLPYSTGLDTFVPLLLVLHISLFQPLYPQFLIPEAFGNMASGHSHKYLPRLVAALSFLLHAKQTLVALLDADPGVYTNRHSRYLAYAHLPHEDERTKAYRSASAVSRVLGALNEHPIVSSVGWDVLMCGLGLSLGLWAAVRGLGPERILATVGFGHAPSTDVKGTQHKKRKSGSFRSLGSKVEGPASVEQKTPAASTRRRKKTHKAVEAETNGSPVADAAAQNNAGDADYKAPITELELEDFEGEEDIPENLEGAAMDWGLFALGGLGTSAVGALHA